VEAVDEMSSSSATWICQFEVYNHDLEIITRVTMKIRFWQIQYIQKEIKMQREVFYFLYEIEWRYSVVKSLPFEEAPLKRVQES